MNSIHLPLAARAPAASWMPRPRRPSTKVVPSSSAIRAIESDEPPSLITSSLTMPASTPSISDAAVGPSTAVEFKVGMMTESGARKSRFLPVRRIHNNASCKSAPYAGELRRGTQGSAWLSVPPTRIGATRIALPVAASVSTNIPQIVAAPAEGSSFDLPKPVVNRFIGSSFFIPITDS